jgi:hypothetical protein
MDDAKPFAVKLQTGANDRPKAMPPDTVDHRQHPAGKVLAESKQTHPLPSRNSLFSSRLCEALVEEQDGRAYPIALTGTGFRINLAPLVLR